VLISEECTGVTKTAACACCTTSSEVSTAALEPQLLIEFVPLQARWRGQAKIRYWGSVPSRSVPPSPRCEYPTRLNGMSRKPCSHSIPRRSNQFLGAIFEVPVGKPDSILQLPLHRLRRSGLGDGMRSAPVTHRRPQALDIADDAAHEGVDGRLGIGALAQALPPAMPGLEIGLLKTRIRLRRL